MGEELIPKRLPQRTLSMPFSVGVNECKGCGVMYALLLILPATDRVPETWEHVPARFCPACGTLR